jgi:alkylhydroperoxidase family enzyme
MSWVLGGGDHSFADLMALRPNLAADVDAFSAQLWRAPGIDPVTIELCRLRVAQLHGARAALAERTPEAAAAGLTEERIALLADYGSAPGFSARERACLELSELFVMDPSAIDDATFVAVRDALGETGTVALLEALAVFDGFSRAQVMLDAAPATETRA